MALKVLGGGFLGWSAVATVAVAGFYRLWESLPYMLPDLTNNPLLAAVLGALFVGVGVGLVIRQGASAGGDDALALSISKITGWRVGRCYLFTDLSVLALSLTYIPVVKIAFSLITVTISSAVIDVLGALFVGVGVGLVIRQGASAGGDDALALSISKITGWRVGRCYLFTDLSVLALSLTYIPVVKIAFSLITVTISSAVIDVV